MARPGPPDQPHTAPDAGFAPRGRRRGGPLSRRASAAAPGAEIAAVSDRPRQTAAGRFWRGIAVTAGFAAVVWLVYRPDRVDLSAVLPVDRGDPAFLLWTLSWVAHGLTTAPFGVFGAPIFHPNPLTLAYSDPMLAVAPVFGVLAALSGSPQAALAWTLLALATANFVAMYVLVRWLTDSTAAGIAAGIAFGASGWILANAGHIQLQVAFLLPLSFWLLGRVLIRASLEAGWWLAACQVALVASSLYLGLAWAVGAAVVVLAWAVCVRFRLGAAAVRALAAAVVTPAVVLVPVLMPFVTLQSGAARFRRPLADMIPLRPTDLFRLPWGGGHVDAALFSAVGGAKRTAAFLPESTWWPGIVVAVAAVCGIVVLCRRRPAALVFRYDDAAARLRYARVLLGAGAAGAVLALGPTLGGIPMPFRALWAWVPGFAGVRVPARFAVLAVLATALCVGVAVAALASSAERRVAGWRFATAARRAAAEAAESGLVPLAPGVRRPLWVPAVVAAAIVALLVGEVWGVQVPWVPFAPDAARTAPYRQLAPLGPGAVVELPMAVPDSPPFAEVEASRMADAAINDTAWHPRVNGYSGFTPAGYAADVALLNTYPAPAAVARLRQLGVRWVILHAPAAAPGTLQEVPAG